MRGILPRALALTWGLRFASGSASAEALGVRRHRDVRGDKVPPAKPLRADKGAVRTVRRLGFRLCSWFRLCRGAGRSPPILPGREDRPSEQPGMQPEPPRSGRSRQGLPGAQPRADRSRQELQMCEFVELSYVSGRWPGWGPKLIATSQVRGLGFRVLLSYYVAEERGASL